MSTPPEIRLSPTSYVVLGLLDWLGPSSPYRLKKALEVSVADFHPVPHTSFYAEPARLAEAGYLDESQEEGGRRRKRYSLTDRGREALSEWLADPVAEPTQVRSPPMLKVFFGADPGPLAESELARHRELLAGFEDVRDRLEHPPHRRRALDAGIAFHRTWVETWERMRAETDEAGGAETRRRRR